MLIGYSSGATPPWIRSDINAQNGWDVFVDNGPPGAAQLAVEAVAFCVS